jgi:hypothetical protein
MRRLRGFFDLQEWRVRRARRRRDRATDPLRNGLRTAPAASLWRELGVAIGFVAVLLATCAGCYWAWTTGSAAYLKWRISQSASIGNLTRHYVRARDPVAVILYPTEASARSRDTAVAIGFVAPQQHLLVLQDGGDVLQVEFIDQHNQTRNAWAARQFMTDARR